MTDNLGLWDAGAIEAPVFEAPIDRGTQEYALAQTITFEECGDQPDPFNINTIITNFNGRVRYVELNATGATGAPAACLIYGVDAGVKGSQFFTLAADTRAVTALGLLHPGYDLEGLALQPATGTLYAAAGGDNAFGQRGYLFTVDPTTGALSAVGYTGYRSVEALAFRPTDGALWGWAEGKGLIRIDPGTGQARLVLRSLLSLEGLAWANNGARLYAAAGRKLYAYHPVTKQLTLLASNLPGETEALEMCPDGLLALGVRGWPSIQAYDLTHRRVVKAKAIPTPYHLVQGIAWPQTCHLAP